MSGEFILPRLYPSLSPWACWSPIMGLLLTKWRPTQHPAEYFINRHVQSSWTKLNWWWRDLSLVSWRVTSCAANIQNFLSHFSFDFAQSYQILAHDQIHNYAVKCYSNYYATKLSLDVGERLSDWGMMNDVSYHVFSLTSISKSVFLNIQSRKWRKLYESYSVSF